MNRIQFSLQTLISTILLSLKPEFTIAGSFDSIRQINWNSLYQCPTGKMIEQVSGYGNIRYISATVQIGCFENEKRATWLILFGEKCQSTMCKRAEFGYTRQLLDARNHTYQIPKAVVGINCHEDNGQKWSCQERKFYQNMTLQTKGESPLIYIGEYFRRYGHIPQYPFAIQGVYSTQYINCFGNADFCRNK